MAFDMALVTLATSIVLSCACIVVFLPCVHAAKADRARSDLATLRTSLAVYVEQVGAPPPPERCLEAFVDHRIVERVPIDPWNHPYRCLPLAAGDSGVDLSFASVGPDGVSGTDDDLMEPESPPVSTSRPTGR